MDEYKPILRCVNCGTEFKPAGPLEFRGDRASWAYACPVCQFLVQAPRPEKVRRRLSAGELEIRLSALLADARASGVTPDDIERVLRAELEFVAELANPGRRLLVNIIDLGPQEVELGVAPVHDQRELLQSRGMTR